LDLRGLLKIEEQRGRLNGRGKGGEKVPKGTGRKGKREEIGKL